MVVVAEACINGADKAGEKEHPQSARHVTPLTSALVLPPSHPVEETNQQEWVAEYEAMPTQKYTCQPSPPRAAA